MLVSEAWRGAQTLTDLSETSAPRNTSCETQQRVQTEWMSPTPHVPRRFPPRARLRARRAATVAVPIGRRAPLTDLDPAAPLRNTRAAWGSIAFSLVATDRPHTEKSGSKVWNSTGRGFRDGTAVTSPSPRTHLQEMLRAPRGFKMRTQRTHAHKYFTLFSHNVPTWTRHAAATLNICRIHIEMQDGN